jgi:hypothetical protein
VLTVVDFTAADFKRRRASAQQSRAFKDFHFKAALLEFECGRESGKARTYDRHTLGAHSPSHARTIAPIFSVLERPARSCKGSEGSRSIFSRIRS